ncbi:TetR/AcrR family transcriptional regulator [Micromonospora zingiberis]|uniref:TetR/AcrR family transcriptional regulator n=1 Tax=Micromonospora zingiberis TaxID=2053011 RepID=A0A4R0GNB4_9ACTN|nr:TetR/AcrR family transcriptional regulator [Micromonospora zingiberis]TCB98387.1 TetR/AcrR family transcriptional regulator [Micromonospora zingiberis]
MTQARPPRADAVRNRRKIMDAAREQITLHGPHVGMDDIAAAAGVAVGTLYRHFPNKADLVAAVIAEYTAQVADDAEAACHRVTSGSPALHEIATFLANVVEASATNHAVKAAAYALGAYPAGSTAEQRASTALSTLIKTGQTEGDIGPDVTIDDIYLLVSTAPTDQPAATRSRWLALMLPGLTTHPTSTAARIHRPRSSRHVGQPPRE